jgi:hypothetical protein
MKKTFILTGLLIAVLTIITSCSKDPVPEDFNSGNYSIKSILADGKTRQIFLYNNSGKIVEYQSFYFCNKYIYDDNDRLIKQEVSVDPYLASSSIHPEKTEMMTSENSSFTGNYIFEYNSAGKLVSQKNYFKKNTLFEYTSMISLEYEGDRIVKRNLHDAKNVITQFYTYEYDSNGNVSKEKHYSYLFISGTEPKLIHENSFKYDDKNNPFIIYNALGQPGLYTNPNNTIETSTVLYEDVPGIGKFSTSKTSYEYNGKGFPTRVNNAEEYKYE